MEGLTSLYGSKQRKSSMMTQPKRTISEDLSKAETVIMASRLIALQSRPQNPCFSLGKRAREDIKDTARKRTRLSTSRPQPSGEDEAEEDEAESDMDVVVKRLKAYEKTMGSFKNLRAIEVLNMWQAGEKGLSDAQIEKIREKAVLRKKMKEEGEKFRMMKEEADRGEDELMRKWMEL